MIYTFDFIDANGLIDHFDLADLADDRAAGRRARAALLESRIAVGVTVWERSRRVASITRGAPRQAPGRSEVSQLSRGGRSSVA